MQKLINSEDLTVEDLFGTYYNVPIYQREYVWGSRKALKKKSETDVLDYQNTSDPVYRLLTDVYDQIEQTDKAKDRSEYFLGSIIVCPSANQSIDGVVQYDLIDGQQRTTTLFLVLLALRHALEDAAEKADRSEKEIAAFILESIDDIEGNPVVCPKLTLQYVDAGKSLGQLVDGQREDLDTSTKSSENIANAYAKARQFIREKCGEDIKEIRKFYGYLSKGVRLVRISTEDVNKALIIFETINERGVGLNAMDLLKNLIFISAEPKQYEDLQSRWKNIIEQIEKTDPHKPMRFIRYFVASDYAEETEIVRENGLYTWFRESDVTGLKDKPVKFLEKMEAAASAYIHMRNGCSKNGQPEEHLEAMMLLSNNTLRQHYSLILAGRNLPKSLFSKFAKQVERLVFTIYIARIRSNAMETEYARLTYVARSIKTAKDLKAFEARIDELLAGFAEKFESGMMNFHQGSHAKIRVRAILGRLTQFVQQAFHPRKDFSSLSRFTVGENEIEHILPQSNEKGAWNEFLEYEMDDEIKASDREEVENFYLDMLGNLTLIDKEPNGNLGNRTYSKKRSGYKDSSPWALTKYVYEAPKRSKSGTSVKANNKLLKQFKKWRPKKMEARQKMLTDIGRAVWGVPSPKTYVSWDDDE